MTQLFTFEQGDACKAYGTTGASSMVQYCDSHCIGLGGSEKGGRWSLYLGDDLLRGGSHGTDCFKNPSKLSGEEEFVCVELEVWGFS